MAGRLNYCSGGLRGITMIQRGQKHRWSKSLGTRAEVDTQSLQDEDLQTIGRWANLLQWWYARDRPDPAQAENIDGRNHRIPVQLQICKVCKMKTPTAISRCKVCKSNTRIVGRSHDNYLYSCCKQCVSRLLHKGSRTDPGNSNVEVCTVRVGPVVPNFKVRSVQCPAL